MNPLFDWSQGNVNADDSHKRTKADKQFFTGVNRAADGVITPAALITILNNGIILLARKVLLSKLSQRVNIFTNAFDQGWSKDIWHEIAPKGMLSNEKISDFAKDYLSTAGQRLLKWSELSSDRSNEFGLGDNNALENTQLAEVSAGEPTESIVLNDVITRTFLDNNTRLENVFSKTDFNKLSAENFTYLDPQNGEALLPFFLDGDEDEDGKLYSPWTYEIPFDESNIPIKTSVRSIDKDHDYRPVKNIEKQFTPLVPDKANNRADLSFLGRRQLDQELLYGENES